MNPFPSALAGPGSEKYQSGLRNLNLTTSSPAGKYTNLTYLSHSHRDQGYIMIHFAQLAR
jgi:hypothetical protein